MKGHKVMEVLGVLCVGGLLADNVFITTLFK